MLSPSPKSRTKAAYLAIFLGWAGVHKFYLGHWNVGLVHVALTAVGLTVFSADLAASDDDDRVMYIYVAAGLAILLGYFYVRRFQLGHPMAQILDPARILLSPWRLFRYPFRLVGMGWRIMLDEEEERQEDRRWRRRLGRHRDYGDDGVGCPVGAALTLLGVMLFGAVVGAIIMFYVFIIGLTAYMAVAAPVASVAIGVIEGVRYLNKNDSQFQAEYVVGQRLWF